MSTFANVRDFVERIVVRDAQNFRRILRQIHQLVT
jgi:hypothetical protein